jgi:glycosyltransferase involved in cell wall biosynthesis
VPIRVLDLRDTHEVGGPGKTILETYRAIDARRFSLHLGAFLRVHETADKPFLAAARGCGMPVHLIRGRNQYDPRLITGLAALVRKLGIDIVHAHEASSDVAAWLASKLHGAALVTTLHGWIGNSAKQRLFIRLDRRMVRRFDLVIAVSGQIRDEARAAGVPDSRLRLLHNAIVLERYRRTGRRGYLGELLGRPVASPVIASIGRLSPEKGQADLIQALGILAARGHRPTTVLVGDGPDRARLQGRVRELGLQDSVHLPGYVNEPERVLEETDLMVLPSHTEGLPNAALEALAMEVPVLATRVGGTPEVVSDGRTGRLIEPRSPGDLADAIADYLADPAAWQDMAREGRVHVVRDFNFKVRTRALEAMYAELMAGR